MVSLLHTSKDCSTWDYDKMPRLNKSLVEHPLSIKPSKQPSRKIDWILEDWFIRPTRYVEWISKHYANIKKE